MLRLSLAFVLFCLSFPQPLTALAAPLEFTGRIVAVTDGDTVKLLTPDHKEIHIRLAEIDAPEKRQPYGARAKAVLSDLCFGKTVSATYAARDRYGRTVAHLRLGDLDINAEMIRRGAAWVYRKYASDPALLALESEARAGKRGLWALPQDQQIPPWEWRAASRAPAQESAPTQAAASGCGTKRLCRDMRDCAEAKHFLNDCGVSKLDGDHDGVPCEALCH